MAEEIAGIERVSTDTQTREKKRFISTSCSYFSEPTRSKSSWFGGSESNRTGVDVISIDDAIGVSLLSKETLAILCELLVDSVSCHERVEARTPAIGLWAQDAPQALCLFLAGSEGSRNLDRY